MELVLGLIGLVLELRWLELSGGRFDDLRTAFCVILKIKGKTGTRGVGI